MALTTAESQLGVVRAQVAAAITGRRVDIRGRLFEGLLLASLLLALLVLAVLLGTVVNNGWSVYTDRGPSVGIKSGFPWVDVQMGSFLDSGLSQRARRAGISQGIIGSFWIAVAVVALAVPLGIGAAIYLEEYALRDKNDPSRLKRFVARFTSFMELNIRNLAGVPSVVYGLLGLGIFVETFNGFSNNSGVDRRTLVAAGVTLAVLVLPIMIITASEAIRAVPQALREGAHGVGATRWEVIRTQVLPYAAPGIFTGALLSIARAVGEAAPLIVIGAVTGVFGRSSGLTREAVFDLGALTDRFVALPTIVTTWSRLPDDEFKVTLSAATIIAMLVFVLLINSIAIVLRNRFEKKRT